VPRCTSLRTQLRGTLDEEISGQMSEYDGRMNHLDRAKRALEREARSGKRTGPTGEDVLEAIREIIAHLEERERKPAVTVNAPSR
jgi:hypothetical protein